MFHTLYSKYLTIDNGIFMDNCYVCKSDNRDTPLNKNFYYRIIISDYMGRRIVSISPNISDHVINNICKEISQKELHFIQESRHLNNLGYRISMMYRMFLGDELPEYEPLLEVDIEYREDLRKYMIRQNDKIISYCKISNLWDHYGNIVVWTDETYRGRGYAKVLLRMLLTRCKLDGIVPMYLVDSKNVASIQLAKSVGFKVVQTEIVGCEVIHF